MVTINQYRDNMKEYIDSLQDTGVKIIYFDMNTRDNDPYKITSLKRLNINANKFYIYSGVEGKWTYTYKANAIAYLFTRHDTKFLNRTESSILFDRSDGPNYHYDIEAIRSHLTIGLRENKKMNNMITMTTHFTSYSEYESNPNTFDVDRTPKCMLSLTNPIPSDLIANICYEEAPVLLEVIEEIRKAFLGSQDGEQYIIHNTIENDINDSIQNLVGGPVLTEDVIKMVYELIVEPVVVSYRKTEHNFVNTTMLYDTNNHFNSKTQCVLFIFDIFNHDTCTIFYVDIYTIFEAVNEYIYRKQITNNKPSQKASRCYEELTTLPMAYLQVLQNI